MPSWADGLIFSHTGEDCCDLLREKGRDLTQSYDKSPYTNRNVKRAKWQHKRRHKKVHGNQCSFPNHLKTCLRHGSRNQWLCLVKLRLVIQRSKTRISKNLKHYILTVNFKLPFTTRRYDFNFHVTNFPFLNSNIQPSPTYGILSHNASYTPGLAPLMNVLFRGWCDFPISFSGRYMQRNVWDRL